MKISAKFLLPASVTVAFLIVATSFAPSSSGGFIEGLIRASATGLVTPDTMEPGPGGKDPLESEPNSPGADWFFNQRSGGGKTVSYDSYQRALDQAKSAEAMTAADRPEFAEAEWEWMGPTNIGGRVTEVAIDPSSPDTVYAATASGGVWKSTDAGVNYEYAWPGDATQAVGAIAAGSDGVLYAGTGESSPGGGSITYGGTGLYRSADGAESWEFVGLPLSGAIGRIVVEPSDPSTIWVAASGDLYNPGGQRGLYVSEDGGDSWERVLAGENDTTGAVDIAIDPGDPDNLLVAMWDHQRLASHRIYAGEGSGVWRSTDGGASWTEVAIPHGLEAHDVGRIGVAFAASDPSRAYAIVGNKLNGTGVGFFRSDDGGATWTKTAVGGGSLSQSSFGWWFGRTWVDPAAKDTVWVAGVNLLRSTNGGDSFSSVGGVHADQHGLAWDPQVAGRVYLGNDGGMYTSADNGSTWTAATLQGATQHYTVDVGELSPDHVVTGLQDNGCIKNWSGLESGTDAWNSFGLCGDGLETLINPTHERTLYACSQYGSCSISPEGIPAGVPMTTTNDRRGWWTPIVFDPANSMTMYFGGNRVNRSANGGLSWTAISPDLSRDEPQLDPHSGYQLRGVITTIAVSATDPDTVWAGTDDGLLWKTTDASASAPNWTQVSFPEGGSPPWVTRITVDPSDDATVYLTLSGYRDGDNAPHVLRSEDGGASWKDISGNLPAAPVNDLWVVDDLLVVATDVGVYVSDNGGAPWFSLGNDLPAVPVIELRYHEATRTITAATFGHGIQRLTLP